MRERAPDVAAEVRPGGGTGGGASVADVGLQVRLPQALTRPVGHHRHGVGRQAGGTRHLAGPLSLDRRVPQHGLPPVGQGGEGLGDEAPVGELDDRGVVGGGDGLGHLVERGVVAAGGRRPVAGQPADRDEEVRPERLVGSVAAAQRCQDPLERTVHQVFGVGGVAVAAGQAQGRGPVAQVQLAERGLVTVACPTKQFGV